MKPKLETAASDEFLAKLDELPALQKIAVTWRVNWLAQAHPFQILPSGEQWTIWLLLAGRGSGKGLTIESMIPTPTGWVAMKDLRDGDQVFDENGRVCNVVKAHDPYNPERLYKITFSDGSILEADGDHLWTVWTHQDRKQFLRHGGGNFFPANWATYRYPIYQARSNGDGRAVLGHKQILPKSTDELLDQVHQKTAREDLNLCVPCALPLDLPACNLPIDPWLLGYWLGNGSQSAGALAVGSHKGNFDIQFVREKISALGFSHSERQMSGYTHTHIKGLLPKLRDIKVLWNKHIPQDYLRASINQRVQLLQGLCDADGYAMPRAAEFYTTKLELAKQVYELVCSLGERVTLREKVAKLYGKNCGYVYTVAWRWTIYNPFSLPRKLRNSPAPTSQVFRMRHRMISSIVPIEPKIVRCITVDSQSGLYLAGESMIPTHNTKCASNNIGWWAWEQPRTRGLVMAPTANDIRFTCFEGDSGLLNTIPHELIQNYNKSTFELELKNGSHLRGISADSYERLRGPQFHYAWTDELAAFEYLQEAWDMMMFGLRLGKLPRVIATTTPKPKELIWQLVKREGKDVIVDRASSYANLANLAPTFKQQITQYEGTKLGRQEIHAEIIDPFEAGVVKKAWIKMWPADMPLPVIDHIVYSLDTAFTEKSYEKDTYDRDPTACSVWGLFNNKTTKRKEIILLDCWDDYFGLPDLIDQVKKDIKIRYGANEVDTFIKPHAKIPAKEEQKKPQKQGGRLPDTIVIEDKGSGISLRQMLAREGIKSWPYNPGKADKLARLHSVSHLYFHGIVWFPESETRAGEFKSWTEEMIKQICSYAGEESIKHDDYVDSMSQALMFFADKNWLSMTVIAPDSGVIVKRRLANPYAI